MKTSVRRPSVRLITSTLLLIAAPGAWAEVPTWVTDVADVRADVPYAATDDPAQTLDLLRPRGSDPGVKLPAVVYIHGGAWAAGDKEEGYLLTSVFAGTGDYVAATLNYRLSGQAAWPAQIHDVKAAIRFLRAHADEYGIDANRIAVIGLSAGGHLAAMLGTTVGNKTLEGTVGGADGYSSRVQCVVDYCGPTDLATLLKSPLSGGSLDLAPYIVTLLNVPGWYLPTAAKAASPLTYVTRDDAPTLIIHGTKDWLIPLSQAQTFDSALAKARAETHLLLVDGGGHGDYFPWTLLFEKTVAFVDYQFYRLGTNLPRTQTVPAELP